MEDAHVLTINVGSSSVRFAFFTGGEPPARVLSGRVERIGSPGPTLGFKTETGEGPKSQAFPANGPQETTRRLLNWLGSRSEHVTVAVVTHRLVHGGPNYQAPQQVTPALLEELDRLTAMDPDDLPAEIGMIRAFGERFPDLPQVACFDTAFNADLPRVARLLPMPRRYEAAGVRRYGFHGLSYEFLLGELRRLDGETAANGRVLLAHLGSGASMGFTPAAGLPMGTRSGDLDPGLFPYLARAEGDERGGVQRPDQPSLRAAGISETSSDVRDLLPREANDPHAAEAVALFCYQARKWIGSFTAALGGLDTLVFAGGIGENAAPVRERICADLGFLGLQLDHARNAAHAPGIISRPESRVTVRVIPMDEEIVLARAALTFTRGRLGFQEDPPA